MLVGGTLHTQPHSSTSAIPYYKYNVLYYTSGSTLSYGIVCSCSPVCTVLLLCMLRPWILTALLDSVLIVQTHLLHIFRKMFLGVLPSFFFKQDLWSWIVAILQDSMPSVLICLLHNFNFSLLSVFMAAGLLANAMSFYARWAKAMISLLSPCYGVLCFTGQYHYLLCDAILHSIFQYPVFMYCNLMYLPMKYYGELCFPML